MFQGSEGVMDRRYEARLADMLSQAQVSPDVVDGLLERLGTFIAPFAATLSEPEQRRHAAEYVTGLLSKLQHKTGEGIAYLYAQERQGIQKFIGHVPWDHQPLLTILARQVGQELGEEDGVIVFDPSGFPKKGTKSVGVARQWCGRLGKVENCQVGVYMAYASRKEHAITNVWLYLPKEWAKDRARRNEAGVPKSIKFQTRQELALAMLYEQGTLLPHAWVAGDDEMGRPARFRQVLRERGERYLLAVPSNTTIRDLEATPPEYGGRGRPPKSPFVRVDRWCAALSASAWTRLDVRDGEKGPLVVDAVKRRVQSRVSARGAGLEEVLFITREQQVDGTVKHDYYLSNGDARTSLSEFRRVAKLAHRIEECLERGKGEAGLADYQVRNWIAWHHHQTLSLLAAWFLNQETRRGKNPDTSAHVTPNAAIDRRDHRGTSQRQHPRKPLPMQHALAGTQRLRSLLPVLLSQAHAPIEEPATNVGIQ
jgi:SRSO17 transposase